MANAGAAIGRFETGKRVKTGKRFETGTEWPQGYGFERLPTPEGRRLIGENATVRTAPHSW